MSRTTRRTVLHYFFAHLAQSAERKTFNLVAVGSTPTVGIDPQHVQLLHYFFISSLVQVVRILRFHRRDSGSSPE